MSYKLTCPGCGRYLSSIFRAYGDGRPCPHCGASLQPASAQYYRQLPDDDRRGANHDNAGDVITYFNLPNDGTVDLGPGVTE